MWVAGSSRFLACAAGRLRRRFVSLPWPPELDEQVRGAFLCTAVIGNLLVLPTVSANRGWGPVTGSVLGTVALSVIWIHGYRRRRFAWWSDAVELGLMLLLGLGQASASVTLGPIYNVIFLRSLYGGVRAAIVRTVGYTAVMNALLIVHPASDHMLQPGPLVGWLLPSLAMCTLTDRLLALALTRRRAASARERLLTDTATRLLQARTEAQVRALALDTVSSLLAELPADSIALLADHGRGLEVVASRPMGLPAPVLDDATGDGSVAVLPLRANRGAPTTLYAGARRPLSDDLRRTLDALAGQLALSLGGVRLQEELSVRAMYDGLTRLPNRAQLLERLEETLTAVRSVAAVFIDLDDFKTVNDALGHQVGDHLLRAVAGRLRSCERSGDMVSRLGGDEFAALLFDVATPQDAVAVATRMLRSLDAPFAIEGHEITVQSSIGVALAEPSDTPDTLLRNADTAMYVAKARGKGRCEVFTQIMHEAVSNEFTLRDDLQEAVDARQFVLHYQPLLNLRTGAVLGFEALARWQHPRRGLVPPAEFIPLAERVGCLHEIERQVLSAACHAATTWPVGPHGRGLTVGVNVSPSHLQRPDLVASVQEALGDSGLDPRRLFVEVTENVDAEDWRRVATSLTQLRELGVRVALDDFGTGYSSLSLLAELPIDVVKVDRAFTAGPANAPLLTAVFDLASRLGFATVAEGVERLDQQRMLVDAGRDLVQGFLYSRPVPGEEVPSVLGLLADNAISSSSADLELPTELAC
ncbi:MAG: putative bifunctional diguanylate cyclase/phosphodiesterase [Mycobacterium leprae]